jgi:parallel beta-helix repeat protein
MKKILISIILITLMLPMITATTIGSARASLLSVPTGTPLYGCTTIINPGYYYLVDDWDVTAKPRENNCLIITSNDVIIDGKGYYIFSYEFDPFLSMERVSNVTITNLNLNIDDMNGAIELGETTNTKIKNVRIYSDYIGIDSWRDFGLSVENSYIRCTDDGDGIDLFQTEQSKVFNSTIEGCETAIDFNYDFNTNISNNLFEYNQEVLVMGPDVNYATVTNNIFRNNYDGGIFFIDGANNKIYNNYISAYPDEYYLSVNFVPQTFSLWPSVLGKNIVGGPRIAGNYWTQPNGRGFSDLCPDRNYDGICDVALNLGYGSKDEHALAKWNPIIPVQVTHV